MTNEAFDEAYSKAQTGDFFAVIVTPEGDQLTDMLGDTIQAMSGYVAHIGQITDKATNQAFEAHPPKLSYTNMLDYRGRKGVELYFMRLHNITDMQITMMLAKCKELNGTPYNIGLIADLAARYSWFDVPIIGYFIRKANQYKPMPNPLDLKKGIVCSTTATIVARACTPFLQEYKDPQTITPSIFFEADELDIVDRCMDN
jgi:hypothetical protein